MSNLYAPPSAALREVPNGADGAEDAEIRAHYSLRFPVRVLALASGLFVLSTATLWWAGSGALLPYLVALYAMIPVCFAGHLDRRPRLDLGPRGLRYRPFGWRWIPWSAISRTRLRTDGMYLSIELIGLPVESVASHLSFLRRRMLSVTSTRGSTLCVRINDLDVPTDRIWSGFERYVDEPHAALEVGCPAEGSGAASLATIVCSKAIQLPMDCLGCRADATTHARVRADGSFRSRSKIFTIPCCKACGSRRRRLGLLVGLAPWVLGALVVALAVYGASFGVVSPLWIVVALVACPVAGYRFGRTARRTVDRQIWQMEAVALEDDRIEFRFSDATTAARILSLNAERAS